MEGEPPKCFSESNPKARKSHICCECRGTIPAGERYHVFSGIWDDAYTFKTCDDCQRLRDEISKTYPCGESPIFSQLYEDVFDGNGHPEWIKTFMDTRRKRNAPESPRRWMELREEKINQTTTTCNLCNQTPQKPTP